MLARSIASFAIAAGETIFSLSRRRHLSLARADIVRHKSGIVIAWFDNVRLRRGAKIKSKQRQTTTVRKSLRRPMPIVLGRALKSSRKKSPDFDS